MADVKVVINGMNTIKNAQYKKVHNAPPSSRKTAHEINFDRLKGAAANVATNLTQNPKPNRDQQENIKAQFGAMKKNVDAYCTKTAGTDDVLRAFNKASTEWDLLVKELNR